jgi:hypothetical protein
MPNKFLSILRGFGTDSSPLELAAIRFDDLNFAAMKG